ncbi:hypothetical protein PVAP13_1NG052208 [Panicum virgatum]|uniref:Uncharacterized protein n=1 Tax=Panicum virgatum TaxID=38727 RepID=A0A8T0WPL3_PANVG|nr:hypothetical protein PVAP13_1NG052208 [Panicum virgatum]
MESFTFNNFRGLTCGSTLITRPFCPSNSIHIGPSPHGSSRPPAPTRLRHEPPPPEHPAAHAAVEARHARPRPRPLPRGAPARRRAARDAASRAAVANRASPGPPGRRGEAAARANGRVRAPPHALPRRPRPSSATRPSAPATNSAPCGASAAKAELRPRAVAADPRFTRRLLKAVLDAPCRAGQPRASAGRAPAAEGPHGCCRYPDAWAGPCPRRELKLEDNERRSALACGAVGRTSHSPLARGRMPLPLAPHSPLARDRARRAVAHLAARSTLCFTCAAGSTRRAALHFAAHGQLRPRLALITRLVGGRGSELET